MPNAFRPLHLCIRVDLVTQRLLDEVDELASGVASLAPRDPGESGSVSVGEKLPADGPSIYLLCIRTLQSNFAMHNMA